MFGEALFSSPEWIPFAASVVAAEAAADAGHEPWALTIHKAIPAVEESLRNLARRQEAALAQIMDETADLRARLRTMAQAQQEQAARQFTVTTTVSPGNGAATVAVSKTPPSSASCTAPAPASVHGQGQGLEAPGQGPTTPPTPVTMLAQRAIVPSYKLNRDVHTIPALWKLWTVGIGGAPSIEDLDRRYGPAWRQTQAERQYYSMRKTLIDEIKERTLRAGDGDSGRVVRDMETKRLAIHPPPSLDKVIKALRATKKARAADSYSL